MTWTSWQQLVSMQIVADGHHYITTTQAIQTLLSEHDALFTAIGNMVGGSLSDVKSLILHRTFHSIPSASFVAFASSDDSSRTLRAVGLERLSIRFPLNCAETIATGGRLAVMPCAASGRTSCFRMPSLDWAGRSRPAEHNSSQHCRVLKR